MIKYVEQYGQKVPIYYFLLKENSPIIREQGNVYYF